MWMRTLVPTAPFLLHHINQHVQEGQQLGQQQAVSIAVKACTSICAGYWAIDLRKPVHQSSMRVRK